MTLLFPLRAFETVVDYLAAETTKKNPVLFAVDDAMTSEGCEEEEKTRPLTNICAEMEIICSVFFCF